MKVALVHDYLREYGGAERVLEALHACYPEAPVYTAFVDRAALGMHWQRFVGWDIRESWMTRIPFYRRIYSPLRLIAPLFFEQFDLSQFDVVISSSNMYFAKAVLTKSWTPHICYCHTPPRSLYGYATMSDWKKNVVVSLGGEIINHSIRYKDYLVAQRVDFFIANSQEVRRRIQKIYRREAKVIYPPVMVPVSLPPRRETAEPYFLYVNRLAFSKHPELAIAACTQLGVRLKVVGTGQILPTLQQAAGPTIEFLGAVSDDDLQDLYSGAQALLYPVEDEDFGIVPVEAMAHGVPVIAHRSGGPTETIVQGKTGVFFDELSVESLIAAIACWREQTWKPAQIFHHSQQFSQLRFMREIDTFVRDTLTSKTAFQ